MRDAFRTDPSFICSSHKDKFLEKSAASATEREAFAQLCQEYKLANEINLLDTKISLEMFKTKGWFLDFSCQAADDTTATKINKMEGEWAQKAAHKVFESCMLKIGQKIMKAERKSCSYQGSKVYKMYKDFHYKGKDPKLDKLVKKTAKKCKKMYKMAH